MEIHQPAEQLDPSEYVSSLNSLTGDVVLAAGTNISLVPVGNTITINATDTDTGITQLTGDVTAGPGSGSQAATLATVNSNVGSFGTASNVGTFTVNGKGLITAASNTSIQIAESQVTNLVSDLAGKVTSVSGTADRITSTGGTTPVIDIAATYVGQSSITTLGTITTGVWNGTAIANANLANSSVTIGSTAISLGATSTTLAGLTSVTSTTFVGALTGNADTVTNGLYTTDVGSVVQAYDADLTTWAGITPGANVGTALAVAVGTDGAFVVKGGALGTPSSGVATNITGLPAASVLAGTFGTGAYVMDTSLTNPLLIGSSASGGDLTLQSTSNATKGNIFFGTSTYDEANNRLGIGTTNPASEVEVVGLGFPSFTVSAYTNGSFGGALYTGRRSNGALGVAGQTTSGQNTFVMIGQGNDGTTFREVGAMIFITGETTTSTASGGTITFSTTTIGTLTRAERMRITGVGNIKIAGTATRATTEGTNHLDIFNGTAPVGTLTNGVSVYSDGGQAKVMDSVGTATLLSSLKANGRSTAQTAAVASVATYTVGAADASFMISANVLVTTSTTHNFTVTCAYTDEGNTARTLTVMFSSLAGGVVTAIANAAGAVPYMGVPVHIRCKASTAITIATTGTFTTVTYNVEGIIRQIQ